jgi:SAM-dependent methyltransferase
MPSCLNCGAEGGELWARARDIEYRTGDEPYAFFRCSECGVLFIQPVPSDRLGEIYPPNYYSFDHDRASWVFRVKQAMDRRFLARWVRQLPGERLAVLDIGGGTGWLLDVVRGLEARVQDTQVVDLDEAAAERARARGHGFFLGRIEDYETSRRFDLILMLNLIEHVENPLAVLQKAAGLLTPGGRILLQTPNYDSWDARLFRSHNWAGLHTPRHWVLYTAPAFERTAARAGLVPVSWWYTQGASFWASSLLGLLAERGLVSITRQRSSLQHPLFGLLTPFLAAFDLARLRLGARTSQMFFVLRKSA